jgi:hypothetical protein
MHSRIELEQDYIAERLRSERANAARRRLTASCAPDSLHRVARPIARALLSLGARLARYANPEPAAYVPARSAELN